jgi:Tol biopolymer transport system component
VQLKRPGPLTTRVSIATDGTEGTRGFGGADNPAMSADGRFVAFDSQAGNLVVPNDGSSDDVFLRDRLTGTTTRISSAPDGSVGNLPSLSPTISADGRFIAFTSYARNLVASDTNLVPDVFIHDRLTSTTTRVSMAPGGQANGPSEDASMSSDGRFVAFTSDASNLVPGDTNQVRDAFVHDRTTGTTRRVSVASDGRQATNAAFDTSISADGRSVAWTSLAPELVAGDTNGVHDVFVHDLTASTTTRVSVGSARTQASAESSDAILSADGRLVAFASRAPNLVEGDTNGNEDVFVHDLVTATTARVSVGPGGQQGDKRSWQPTISPDGSVVGFASEATNLVEGDTNAYGDVFLHDRSTGATARVSLASDGSQGTVGWSRRPVISADGAHVAFVSGSRTLVVGDTNNEDDIFVRDLTG